jgi:hypothetical protein
MFATIDQGHLNLHGNPTTSDFRDMGPVLVSVTCKQTKENIAAVAAVLKSRGCQEVGFSSDLYHPAACGVHPRFDGVALISRAIALAFRQ